MNMSTKFESFCAGKELGVTRGCNWWWCLEVFESEDAVGLVAGGLNVQDEPSYSNTPVAFNRCVATKRFGM
jgi:hypothetical protein